MDAFRFSLSTRIEADEALSPIRHAADILRRDMRDVLTARDAANVIRVTLDPRLPPEGYRAEVTPDAIRLTCGDALGAVYALLGVSERFLGVLPMGWWNEQTPRRVPFVDIPPTAYASPRYAVRHRGWFINDEVLIDGWKDTPEDALSVWQRIFETLLRCGGNMVIPGTDRQDETLWQLASDMGLALTQHHAEPLGARMFGRVWPELKGSYRLYPDKFEQLWREAAQRYAGRDVIYAVGFRGQGDGAFWSEDESFDTDEKRGAEISRILRKQMEIVREVSPDARFCTNLYGEMMHLYRAGHLRVPDEVIKVWADNGFGCMLSRRQGGSDPRVDAMPRHEAGENGVYFHASFYDLQAANHVTQLQIPPQAIADELAQLLSNGADDFWIINAGSVKPHIYILDLIRSLWTSGDADAAAHARAYARAYFGSEAVAGLLLSYAECAVPFGPHRDNLAGEQYYHYTVRELASRLMRGETGEAERLAWAERGDLYAQAEGFARRCAPAIPKWTSFIARCDEAADALCEDAALLLRSTLRMNAQLHLSGCRILCAFADAARAHKQGQYDRAFYHACEALEYAQAGYAALRGAEHGRFINIYRNDCFANLGLTDDVLRVLRGWLRAAYDGPFFWNWEREHRIDPRDRRICLLTHRSRQLSDDELYRRMKQKRAF